jgi:hypothetical protein
MDPLMLAIAIASVCIAWPRIPLAAFALFGVALIALLFGAVSLAMFLCSLIMRAILQLLLLARGSR